MNISIELFSKNSKRPDKIISNITEITTGKYLIHFKRSNEFSYSSSINIYNGEQIRYENDLFEKMNIVYEL